METETHTQVDKYRENTRAYTYTYANIEVFTHVNIEHKCLKVSILFSVRDFCNRNESIISVNWNKSNYWLRKTFFWL